MIFVFNANSSIGQHKIRVSWGPAPLYLSKLSVRNEFWPLIVYSIIESDRSSLDMLPAGVANYKIKFEQNNINRAVCKNENIKLFLRVIWHSICSTFNSIWKTSPNSCSVFLDLEFFVHGRNLFNFFYIFGFYSISMDFYTLFDMVSLWLEYTL